MSSGPGPPVETGLWRVLTRHRVGLQLAADQIAWALALTAASLLRYDFQPSSIDPLGLLAVIAVAAVVQTLAGLGSGLYLGKRRFGSFEEVAVLAPTTAGVTMALFLGMLAVSPRHVPLSAILGGGVGALGLMGAVRYAWRLTLERRLRPNPEQASRLLVFGAGESGEQVITAMVRNPDSPYVPVALLDDDVAKQNLRVRGVPVVGDRQALLEAAQRWQADGLLIAMPSASSELIRELSALAGAAGLPVTVLPPVAELIDGQVGVSDIRPLSPADLLGRHEIDTDVGQIAGYLTGRRVLVTGAGGSIGSELCRQIYRFAPAELIMVDRDESALHAVQLSLNGRATLDASDVALLDVRDRERLDEVVGAHRPHVIFHAAALKHVTALERHPCEAVKTNVWGTQNVLEAAVRHGVEHFVNVSTDKAANPGNVLGYTKRLAERLTAHFARQAPGTFLSVRFGNVIGSRGSVLDTFRTQIAAGGPVTVTHPDVTRYFMTVQEACQLVIQAGAIGEDGQTLVLDMGEPVRIAEVARQLIEQADWAVEVVYTGLRPGEKLHEDLFDDAEVGVRPAHPLIAHVDAPALSPAAAGRLDPRAGPLRLVEDLRALSGGSTPPLSHAADS